MYVYVLIIHTWVVETDEWVVHHVAGVFNNAVSAHKRGQKIINKLLEEGCEESRNGDKPWFSIEHHKVRK